jgi:AcrR family transcriptional regulator
MRAVAERLGVTPIALYHHVADKNRLEKLRRCTRGVWGSSRSGLVVCVPLVAELVALFAGVCLGVSESLLIFGFELIAEPLRVS